MNKLNNLIFKFLKINKYNKSVFISSEDIDKPTYEIITNIFDQIDLNTKYEHNPIYKHQTNDKECFFITCCGKNMNLTNYDMYKVELETRIYKEKYINIYIKKYNKIKDPNFKIIDFLK